MNGLKNENIICFAGEDWWYHNPHSNFHLMKSFAEENRILFVNSIGLRMPNVFANKRSWARIFKKLKSMLVFFKKAEPNIWVLTPWVFPGIGNATERINRVLLKAQLLCVMKHLGFSRPILWVCLPTFKDIAFDLKRKGAIALAYYCVDNISFYTGADQKYIFSLDIALQQSADVAFFVNHKLVEERKVYNPNTHFLPHGVDYEHFARCQSRTLPLPEDIARIPEPRAGYMGAIFQLDYELIEFLAKKNPKVSFVFIGEVQEDTSRVDKLSNVFFIGKKPYETIPNYLQALHCHCLFYDSKDTFNNYRNPKKLKEYLATGTPVVSMTNFEIAYYRDIVGVAENYGEFDRLLHDALEGDTPDKRQKRIEYASKPTWDDVAAYAGGLITDSIRKGKE